MWVRTRARLWKVHDISVATGFSGRGSRRRPDIRRRLAGLSASDKKGEHCGSGGCGARRTLTLRVGDEPDHLPSCLNRRGARHLEALDNVGAIDLNQCWVHRTLVSVLGQAGAPPSLEEPMRQMLLELRRLPERMRTLSMSSQGNNPSLPAEETNDGLRLLGTGVDEPVGCNAMDSACAAHPGGLQDVQQTRPGDEFREALSTLLARTSGSSADVNHPRLNASESAPFDIADQNEWQGVQAGAVKVHSGEKAVQLRNEHACRTLSSRMVSPGMLRAEHSKRPTPRVVSAYTATRIPTQSHSSD